MGEKDLTVKSVNISFEGYEALHGYLTETLDDPGAVGPRVLHFTWGQVESNTGLSVDTVIFDCEGCWWDVVKTYKDQFRQDTIF